MSDDSGTQQRPGHDEMYCRSCGSVIKERAEICPSCGVRNTAGPAGAAASGKDRSTAAILALLLGGVGAHHFYLGNTTRALLYLVFFWTFIPGMIAFVEGIIYLSKTDAEFQAQYVDGSGQRQSSSHGGTVYCSACGTEHAAEAELCPECGVRNPVGRRQSASGSATGSATGSGSQAHDPADYDTTVGPNWYYAVAAPTVFTIPALAFMVGMSTNSGLTGLGAVVLLTAVVLPIVALYFDRQYVRANSTWNPSVLWMAGFFVLYPLNVVLSAVYLYRRHETVGDP